MNKLEKNEQNMLKKKMSKKALKAYNDSKRVRVNWNIGVRVFQANSDYDRKSFKTETKEIIKDTF